MFDIGWSEMAIIAVVALVVVGPKELPSALRTFTQWMKSARKLAREFQGGIDQIVREAELDEARKAIQATTKEVQKEIETAVDPTGDVKSAMTGIADAKIEAPKSPPTPAAAAPADAAPAVAAKAGD